MNDSAITLPSAPMKEIYDLVPQVAQTKAAVLITGETGVGKEIIATSIHKKSSRKAKPFKVINCGTLQDSLQDSELFGHEKGAFTGAIYQRHGVFEQATGGTLFLDEVSEMPPETQVKFLRVLETQQFTRIGGNKNINVDVRVVAATNRDIKQALADKTLRSDLYYRLNVFNIHIPSLRERNEDIPPLVDAFISELSHEYGKHVTGITSEALQFLKHAAWPGNIRQLKNVVGRAIIVTQTAELELADFHADVAPVPQLARSESRKQNPTRKLPSEVSEILARLSVIEFTSIFAGIPIYVWQYLPAETRRTVIREASFHFAELLGGYQDAIYIDSKDLHQILAEVAQKQIAKHGSLTRAARSLDIDSRTFKRYIQRDEAEG